MGNDLKRFLNKLTPQLDTMEKLTLGSGMNGPLVLGIIIKTRQETVKEIFHALEKVKHGGWAVDTEYEKVRKRFMSLLEHNDNGDK